MTLSRSNPRAKPRWVVSFTILSLGLLLLASTALAAPSFTFVPDDQGANDEPGQKDLTAQASAFDPANNDFYTAWKWDDTTWSGNNTGDACSLFDTDADGNVNYAVCVTVGGSPATALSTRVYSCGDAKPDRCTTPIVLEGSRTNADWCTVAPATATFPPPPQGGDLQATCNITKISTDTFLADIDNGTLLNSCSYPSQQPNSDPSDCVLTVANLNTSISTLSAGTTTWSATLNDTATLNPTTATGSVVFKLWGEKTGTTCSVLIWESASVNLVSGAASTVGAGTTSGTNVITNLTVDADGVYYWTVDYTPTGAFNPSSSACGETTTITPASVAGSAG